MGAPGHRGNNFHQANVVGQSIAGQTITGVATVNGAAIVEPWRTAAQIAFLINVGAISATFAGTIRFQGLRRDDGTTWEDLTAFNQGVGGTALTGGDAKIVDAGAGEDAVLLATLYTQRVLSEIYGSVRISIAGTVAAQTIVVGVVHVLNGQIRKPTAQVDEMFAQQYSA